MAHREQQLPSFDEVEKAKIMKLPTILAPKALLNSQSSSLHGFHTQRSSKPMAWQLRGARASHQGSVASSYRARNCLRQGLKS